MIITLEKEANITKHGFFCKLSQNTKEIIIQNAFQSDNARGWADYAPFASSDGKNWIRLNPGKYTGKEFIFKVQPETKYVCWFPPYNLSKINDFMKRFSSINENVFAVGNPTNKKIVLLAGQHPGETMGLFFIEGAINAINNCPNILNDFSFVIFPTINRKGIENQNHRLTPDGIDLNRQWNKNHPILEQIKTDINKLDNIYAIIDIHGDEVSKKDYVIYNSNLKNSIIENSLKKNNFILIKKQNYLKKLIKNLIRNRKFILPQGDTARDFFEKKGKIAITIELSAHSNTPQSCIEKGYSFIKQFQR